MAHDWDAAYTERGTTAVSWYEPTPRVSLEIIAELAVPPDTPVVDVGGGASSLARALTERGFTDVTVLDLSSAALEAARHQTPAAVTWLLQDLLTWRPERRYGLWHDRAVLHFFVDEADRRAYRETVRAAVAGGGYVVLGAFAPHGPDRCSGLPVRRYAASDFRTLLGDDFVTVLQREDDHVTPRGAVQPFAWAALRRRADAG